MKYAVSWFRAGTTAHVSRVKWFDSFNKAMKFADTQAHNISTLGPVTVHASTDGAVNFDNRAATFRRNAPPTFYTDGSFVCP